ncbi:MULTISPECIES: GNAT family N-acetyltransferase [Halorussus]|uniref:GNAT family N-acetyltransferase n=1 Tax=Halorussus TaxID=1070314 RepID=UPI000E20E79A|nr:MULTISPECIES: GNAT family N-acetyltransferase [Halorussus]NHN58584.1 GNAT family N-acetyltransferase [Halorussus sp. JP-T4]
MGLDIELIRETERDEWDSCVVKSPQTTFFHRYDALQSVADYFDAALYPLIGYRGQEPVGILPLFELGKGPFTIIASPPPHLEVNIGPALLNYDKVKQRKKEKRHREFVDGCLDFIEGNFDTNYVDLKTATRYNDVRQFIRRGYDVGVSYTYVLDLTPSEEELLGRFSRDARSNITNVNADEYVTERGSAEEIPAIVNLVQRRFDEQDLYYWLNSELAVDLYTTSSSEYVRPYVCRVDGKIVGGILALEHGDTMYRWQSGSRLDVDIPVTELLDWHVIQDARERDLKCYDLVGAMEQSLCDYKSKFAPDPVPVYTMERKGIVASVAEQAYSRMSNMFRDIVGL